MPPNKDAKVTEYRYEMLSQYYSQEDATKILDYLAENEQNFPTIFSLYKIYTQSGFFILKKHETELPCEIMVTRSGETYVQLIERIGAGRYKRCDLSLELNSGKIFAISLERIHEQLGQQEFAKFQDIIINSRDLEGKPKTGIVPVSRLYYLNDRRELNEEDGSSQYYDKVVTITEYQNGGSLDDRLKNKPLSDVEKQLVFRNACQGILAFKQAGYSHNDLHSGNILLQVDEEDQIVDVVISDLGKATKIGDEIPKVINLYLIPPNHLGVSKYIANKFDEFSLGLLLYLLYVGKLNPWMALVFDAADEAKKGSWDKWKDMGKNSDKYLGLEALETVPEPIASMIKNLLEPDLEKRVNVEDVIESFH